MTLLGVQGIKIGEPVEEMITPDIADYGEEIELGNARDPSGGKVTTRGSRTDLVTIFDRFGEPRRVLKGAAQYHLGKRVYNPITEKVERAFFTRPPAGTIKKNPKEGEDFLTCQVCGMEIKMERNLRTPPPNPRAALEEMRGYHHILTHPSKAAWYMDDELLNRVSRTLALRRR